VKTRVLLTSLVAIVGVAGYAAGSVLATPPSMVTSTLFAVGQFHQIDARSKTDIDPSARITWWKSLIDTSGETDVHILENRIAPGGSFGWHSHPGPSLVVVKSGTLTLYSGHDPTCTPEVIPAGSGFVDNGGDIHLVRNEGSVETVVYVTSLVPRGAVRRIDEPSPGNCPF